MNWLRRLKAAIDRDVLPGARDHLVDGDSPLSGVRAKGSARVRPRGPAAERRRIQAAYSAQRDVLEQRFKQQGVGIFVADYALDSAADEVCATYAIWTRGVPTLLPETDVVVLTDVVPKTSRQEGIIVPWDTLLRITGDACLVLEPGFTPPRWRTVMWPNTRMLNALRDEAERL